MDIFQEWLDSIFAAPLTRFPGDIGDHAVAPPSPEAELDCYVRLLEQPGRLLAPYPAASIGQGLDFLFNGLYQMPHVLLDPDLPRERRLRGLRGIENLFREIFAAQAEPAHPAYARSERLDSCCYMFWDVFPTWGGGEALREECAAILQVMENSLELDSIACIESALHGLNHWVGYDPPRVRGIIDRLLASRRPLNPTVRQHAEWAKAGSMQ